MPALVLWGEQDPWLPAHLADAPAAALGGETEVVRLPDAGHWPRLDDDRAIGCVSEYLQGYRYSASAIRSPV
jgi:pimeloyl-ACP methyl ester carboxylesterase